jgi:hypothetical protein
MKRLSLALAGLAAIGAIGVGAAGFVDHVNDRNASERRADLQNCTSAPRSQSDAAASAAMPPTHGLPAFSNVVVIVMENKDCGDVIGDHQAPFLNALAHRSALATNYFGIAHPSLPNYLALTGGSTFGITQDCVDCVVDGSNLVDELEGAGISWKAYMDALPRPCFTGATAGRYAKKHDPFLYYNDVAGNPARCSRVVPLSELASDLKTGGLPRFAWITPDLCHDMHDCGVAAGDQFLASVVPGILRALGPTGVLFITWDEGETNSGAGCCEKAVGGRVATIAAGQPVRSGIRVSIPYDHYSLLRTIEDAWHLPELRDAGCACTRPLTALFRARGSGAGA